MLIDYQRDEIKKGLINFLEIKDSDIRIDVIQEGQTAVDRGLHIGGVFSSIIPMIALFYSGVINVNEENPTALGNDVFVLSKGHSVAGMAAVYADKGYFDREILKGSRSYDSILNGHPGPILPGVHTATGPLGQGLSVATGFALTQQIDEVGNTFCLVGDGELQEGNMWESIMYAGVKKLDNLCVIVDRNHGQNDFTNKNVLPMDGLKDQFEAFGFYAVEVNGTQYDQILENLIYFIQKKYGKPVAIISDCKKGEGGFSIITESHKVSMKDDFAEQEIALQMYRRKQRIANACAYLNIMMSERIVTYEQLCDIASSMNYNICVKDHKVQDIGRVEPCVKIKRAPYRRTGLHYKAEKLPKVEIGQTYQCHKVLANAITAFGEDPHMVTIDADIGTITGLYTGMIDVDERRALNVGIAESNMMGIAEAFAARGYNAWCGTFGVFFDWRVMRRIAVSYQERMESIMRKDGWLSEGHELDITFVASASNIDTQTNGATHMSTDDICALSSVPHLKIIDTSCPQQMLAVMKWIAEGNKGLVLLRTMRPKVKAIYDESFVFEYGNGYIPNGVSIESADAVIISSGRGVHEAIDASKLLEDINIKIAVVDMPSIDEELFLLLNTTKKPLIFAEQNNAYLYNNFMQTAYKKHFSVDINKVLSISTLDEKGEKQFLKSATYEQLCSHLGLGAQCIAQSIKEKLKFE